MPNRDTNHNGIPDRIDRVIAKVLGLLAVAGAGAIQVIEADPTLEVPAWVQIVVTVALPALLTYVALAGRPGGGSGAVLPVLLLVLAVGASGCPRPYDAAWRSLDGVIRARDATAQGLAATAAAKHRECLSQYGAKSEGYATCIKAHREALRHWRQHARPAIQSALQVTASALQIAERAEADEPPDWLALVRPAVCALLRVVTEWGHLLPDKARPVLGYLAPLSGVVCTDGGAS